jgi:hypothetical protein
VPEAFSRRYEEMRSSNNTIAAFASLTALILYIIGGCFVGLFFLLREHWVLWKQPLQWGFFISLLNLLGGLCELPLSWWGYDTALSAREFLVEKLLTELGACLFWTLLLTLTFMSAESLTRRAFPHMIQQWRLWSPQAASSISVLGRTLGGYLIVGFDFAFVVAIYFLTTRHFNWWTPSDVLFQPNVLAAYFPWLSPIAQSLRAGFWEECLFRAVPLAGAALLGNRFGGRKWFIGAALILQAVVFGAGHANYPSQPAYARLVELIIPSFVFAGIYLRFGLLPSIISHFVFDVVWFSIPLFVSRASGIWIDQSLVILFTLTPLWVVLRARVKRRHWESLSDQFYNSSWQPTVPRIEETLPEIAEPVPRPTLPRGWLIGAGILGLALWCVASNFRQEAPSLRIGRKDAARLARDALAKQGVNLSAEWEVMASVEDRVDQDDRFVWQVGGRDIYHQLVGSYLSPPCWNIRFARFQGDIVQRAEEYNVTIVGGGEVGRVRHQLPESAPGLSLQEADARQLVQKAIESLFQLRSDRLQEISAVASKLPNRADWTFTFSDPNYPLKRGQGRIAISIAGTRIVDGYRYVFVPEDWQRKERAQRNIVDLIRIACWSLLGLFWLAAALVAGVQWSKRNFSVPVFLQSGLLLLLGHLLGLANRWPEIQSGFSTAEPLSHQALVRFGVGIVGALLQSLLFALILGVLAKLKPRETNLASWDAWLRGSSAGLIVAGVTAVFSKLAAPSLSPEIADYSPAGTWLPALTGLFNGMSTFLASVAATLLVFVVLNRFSRGGTLRTKRLVLLWMMFGLALTGINEIESISYWFTSGLFLGVLLCLVHLYAFKTNLSLVPMAVATVIILGAVLQAAYRAFPSALPCGLVEIATVVTLAHLGWARLRRLEL